MSETVDREAETVPCKDDVVDREDATKNHDDEVDRDDATKGNYKVLQNNLMNVGITAPPPATVPQITFYLDDCDANKNVIKKFPKEPIECRVGQAKVLGRGRGVDIFLNHDTVSRSHMKLTPFYNPTRNVMEFEVEVTSTTQVITINEESLLLGGKKIIYSGDKLKLGELEFCIEIQQGQERSRSLIALKGKNLFKMFPQATQSQDVHPVIVGVQNLNISSGGSMLPNASMGPYIPPQGIMYQCPSFGGQYMPPQVNMTGQPGQVPYFGNQGYIYQAPPPGPRMGVPPPSYQDDQDYQDASYRRNMYRRSGGSQPSEHSEDSGMNLSFEETNLPKGQSFEETEPPKKGEKGD
ncbi:uncharacterized protein LOC5511697 [Nematostella vectensis]|uniref:uncharacterized protein LOC5511697 n=1 Tax=Nematostella vectensis TaxID=45351 RepID=UPI00207742DD|nr:uncharacterized protein LOC5511697 [Nematostella vectensis]